VKDEIKSAPKTPKAASASKGKSSAATTRSKSVAKSATTRSKPVKKSTKSRELNYAEWAPPTDERVDIDPENVLAQRIAEIVAQETSGQSLEVADIGCGSGALGRMLSESSPLLQIDGIDISKSLLALAEKALRSDGTPCYREVLDADLTKPIYFAANHYDMVVSSGLFVPGLLGASDLVAMVQSVKARGRLIVGIDKSHFDNAAFKIVIREAIWDKTITEPTYTEVETFDVASDRYGTKALIAQFSKVPTLNDL
jgi:trans-aconitate methyltransferase